MNNLLLDNFNTTDIISDLPLSTGGNSGYKENNIWDNFKWNKNKYIPEIDN